jgi:hypothetical protein
LKFAEKWGNWVRFAKSSRLPATSRQQNWVRFVFLGSFIPLFLHLSGLNANPAHAKRHGQGTHFFLLVKGEVAGRLGRDL